MVFGGFFQSPNEGCAQLASEFFQHLQSELVD